jgi:hypothetical protein
LHIYPGPTGLLDNSGQRLAIAVDPDQTVVNPALNDRSDLPLNAGAAAWGFTWRGSWCGPAAVAVVLPLGDDPSLSDGKPLGQLVVPLTGPSPSCSGSSDAVFVPGVPGEPTAPVLTPPPDWAGLHATLSLPATTDGQTLAGPVVALTNNTDSPIAISPCPNYALVITNAVGAGTELDVGTGALPCAQGPQAIAAHGSAHYTLDSASYDPGQAPSVGTVVTVDFAIAGTATVHATSRVR